MVSNINGLSSAQSSTSRSREKPQAADKPSQAETATTNAGSNASANVSLSPEAKQLQDIEVGLKNFPEVNQERVIEIRNALREGNYSVDPARLAAKIVQFELDI